MVIENARPYKWIFNEKDDKSRYSARKLIVLLFTTSPKKRYKSQQEISEAIKACFGESRQQSAISKGLKELLGYRFEVLGKKYIIRKYEGEYFLEAEAAHSSNLRNEMIKEKIFKREFVYYEKSLTKPQTFVFWIKKDEKKRKKAKEKFIELLGGGYVDIFYIHDKLIIMLDPQAKDFEVLSDVLKNFFSLQYDAYKVVR